MQTDWKGGGGEYHKLSSFFERIGINHIVSCPHTHQQNGSAKRKHRHIVESGLTLLAHASMPLMFWDETFLTATFIINRLPTPVLNYASPIATLFGDDPAYSFLCTFGCACWPHLCPYQTHKLSFQSTQCVFLGYSSHHKGYKCLDVSSGRVYISRDIVFDEIVFPFSKLHPNGGAHLRSEISLLPSSLVDPIMVWGIAMDATNVTMFTDCPMQACALQVPSGAPPMLDRSVITLDGSYLLAPRQALVMDLVGVENPGALIGIDLIHLAPESALNTMISIISDPAHQPVSVVRALSPVVGVSPPGTHLEGDSWDPLCLVLLLCFLLHWPHRWLQHHRIW
jgi:hypothetical protein